MPHNFCLIKSKYKISTCVVDKSFRYFRRRREPEPASLRNRRSSFRRRCSRCRSVASRRSASSSLESRRRRSKTASSSSRRFRWSGSSTPQNRDFDFHCLPLPSLHSCNLSFQWMLTFNLLVLLLLLSHFSILQTLKTNKQTTMKLKSPNWQLRNLGPSVPSIERKKIIIIYWKINIIFTV